MTMSLMGNRCRAVQTQRRSMSVVGPIGDKFSRRSEMTLSAMSVVCTGRPHRIIAIIDGTADRTAL